MLKCCIPYMSIYDVYIMFIILFQEGGGIGPLKRALKSRKWLLDLILEDFPPEDPLPWSHLNAGLAPKTLQRHALEAMVQAGQPFNQMWSDRFEALEKEKDTNSHAI